MDSARQMGEFLYQFSIIDDVRLKELKDNVSKIELAHKDGDFDLIRSTFLSIMNVARNNSYYNILESAKEFWKELRQKIKVIEAVMGGVFRRKFPIIPDHVTWKWNKPSMRIAMLNGTDELLRPVYHLVDELLANSSVQVIVYSGQYDAICSTSGALAWLQRLTWHGMDSFYAKPRLPLVDPDTDKIEMYVRATDQLKFYWVLESGHGIAKDAPDTALRMLQRILNNADT